MYEMACQPRRWQHAPEPLAPPSSHRQHRLTPHRHYLSGQAAQQNRKAANQQGFPDQHVESWQRYHPWSKSGEFHWQDQNHQCQTAPAQACQIHAASFLQVGGCQPDWKPLNRLLPQPRFRSLRPRHQQCCAREQQGRARLAGQPPALAGEPLPLPEQHSVQPRQHQDRHNAPALSQAYVHEDNSPQYSSAHRHQARFGQGAGPPPHEPPCHER